MNTQLETLCEDVFNGCAKVLIFLMISALGRRIACVFWSFLVAGWLVDYLGWADCAGWAGWAGQAGLHMFSFGFQRSDVG